MRTAFKRQTQLVADWLMDGGSLSDREADRMFGVRRLAARIREIREAYGDEAVSTEYEGRGKVRWARYRWAQRDEQMGLGL